MAAGRVAQAPSANCSNRKAAVRHAGACGDGFERVIVQLTDRAYQEPLYQAVEGWLEGEGCPQFSRFVEVG